MVGPPPPPLPPLPPPLKAPSHNTHLNNQLLNNMLNNNGTAGGENFDSDSGMEVVEEPTLRPSELVRGNHNRTMSTISGKYL